MNWSPTYIHIFNVYIEYAITGPLLIAVFILKWSSCYYHYYYYYYYYEVQMTIKGLILKHSKV